MATKLPKDVLARARKLLKDFHSRKPQTLICKVTFKWPSTFEPLGPAVQILYDSDKRDPNMTDADSKQGVWKPFRHKHIAPQGKDATWVLVPKTSGEIPVPEPGCLVFLGYCPGFTFVNMQGEDEEHILKNRLKLYTDESGRMLVSTDSRKVHFAWVGPKLEITWRGIIN